LVVAGVVIQVVVVSAALAVADLVVAEPAAVGKYVVIDSYLYPALDSIFAN
jgi:hypothetical protein